MKNKKVSKKLLIILIIIVLAISILILGKYLENKKYDDKLDTIITQNNWSRETKSDTEFIYFNEKGDFGYYCSCGNGVDYYELCDSYKYDEKTQTIKLKCLLPIVDNKIKVIEYDEEQLTLNINGEERTFVSQNIKE